MSEHDEIIEKLNEVANALPGVLDVGYAPVRVWALQFGFGDGAKRPIDIPKKEWEEAGLDDRLELAFMYGQNDFQPRQKFYSVSVGDVIDLGAFHGSYLVKMMGFRAMSTPMIEEWSRVPRRERSFHKWVCRDES